jgi:hypothetical protein
MSKVLLHFKLISFFLILFHFGKAQEYVSLSDPFQCGTSKAYSIYATADEVDLLGGYLDECGDLEYLKIIGYKPGSHWKLLFDILGEHQKLKGLELYYNEGLEEVSKKIGKNVNLKVITIIGNRRLNYNDLFKKLSRLKQLESVTLIDNKLTEIPDALGDIKQLKKLKISGNEGVNYEKLISKLKKVMQLEELSIPLNSLSEIPENINELTQLKTLDIRKNYISEFPNSISRLDSLQEIKAEENIIIDISNEFEKLKNLNIKYLSFDDDGAVDDLKVLFPDANIETKKYKKENENKIEGEGSIGKTFNTVNYIECWDAIDQYNSLFNKRFSYSDFDSLDFFSRLTDVDYCYNDRILADGSYEGVGLVLHNKRRWVKSKHTIPRYKLKKDEIGFSVTPNGNFYPELKAFTGMVWIYVGGKTKNEFYNSYVKNKEWKDVFLEYDYSKKTFFLVLKGLEYQKIAAYPRYINKSASVKEAQKQYNKRFNMYEKRLTLRAKRFDKTVDKEREKNRKIFKKWQNLKWRKLEAYMCEYEKSLKRASWLDFKKHMIQQQHNPLDTSIANTDQLKLSLNIKRVRYVEQENVSVKKNLINSVSAYIDLNIKDSLRITDVPIDMYLYKKGRGLTELYKLDGTTGVEFATNCEFVVVLQKKNKFMVLSKEVFMNEIRSNFVEKGKIEIRFLKPFKTYTMSALWRAIKLKEK